VRDRLRRWIRRNIVDSACPYCDAIGNCLPGCPELLCPECGGLGVVIDFDNPMGVDMVDGPLFGGKPCPRGCPAP
jgi:hypothetical protein